jgi:hypothetical protein
MLAPQVFLVSGDVKMELDLQEWLQVGLFSN